jgi:rod shape determining protein RodA
MRKGESLVAHFDWILFSAYMILLIMGVATVYSTAYNEDHPNLFDFSQKYGKQIIWLGVSLFLGLMVFLIDSDIYRKFCIPISVYTFIIGCCIVHAGCQWGTGLAWYRNDGYSAR